MIFRFVDKLLEKSESGKGFLATQRAGIQALSTILRKPAIVTKIGPHVRDSIDLKRYMFTVVISLMPCLFFGIYNTGRNAFLSVGILQFSFFEAFVEGALHVLPLVLISYAIGGLCEVIFAQIRGHEISEGFLVTGMLYPLICPATIPWWMFALGIIFGVIIGKEVFGGVGMNIFNPALTARAFLFFAYPAQMSGEVWIAKPLKSLSDGSIVPASWTFIPHEKILAFIDGVNKAPQAVSGATPLAVLSGSEGGSRALENFYSDFGWWDSFFGFIPGSIGETSTLMCLIGAAILLITGIASYRTMIAVFAGGFVAALCFYIFSSNPDSFFALAPHYQWVIGGFAFGAIFMATDPVSSPLLNKSKYIYGFLIGVLCVLIRLINPAYPEGMMLAILFMNIFAPLIDHYVIKGVQKRRKAYAR